MTKIQFKKLQYSEMVNIVPHETLNYAAYLQITFIHNEPPQYNEKYDYVKNILQWEQIRPNLKVSMIAIDYMWKIKNKWLEK